MTVLGIHEQTQQDVMLVPLLCFHFVWKLEMSSIAVQKQSKWELLGALVNHQLCWGGPSMPRCGVEKQIR